MPTTLEIFEELKRRVAAIPLDPSVNDDEKLFQAVELAANKKLGAQLTSLLVLKNRAALIVPMRVVRTIRDQNGELSVLGTKMAEVALIYSDKAYFKASQAVTFGSDKNLGLFATDEAVEQALCGAALSPFGGIIPGDSDPITLSESEQAEAASRTAWMMLLYVPIGLIETAVA